VRRTNPASSIDWQSIAASLGADVPVCLADRTSLVWGIGEHIVPAAKLPRLDAVLVCPLSASPFGKTKSVFGQLSLPPVADANPPAPLPAFANAAALVDYMRAIGNDLRAPAHTVLPDSAAAEAALAELPDCLYVSLSGAGPTSYGIFADARRAAEAAEQLRALRPNWWVVATKLGD
jgi:4-diphosphocytidyl-2-C-methyl-D-erythritol kinase